MQQSEGRLLGKRGEVFPAAVQEAIELPSLYLHMYLMALFLSGALEFKFKIRCNFTELSQKGKTSLNATTTSATELYPVFPQARKIFFSIT